MRKKIILLAKLWPMFFALVFLVSCETDTRKNKQVQGKVKEFFSVRINGVLWVAKSSKGYNPYRISYKSLSRQLTIVAEAADGSTMEVSFHSIDKIVPGTYPSTENDNGIKSGIFYHPVKKTDHILVSTSFDIPIQENTVQVIKIDKIDQGAYLIEGVFAPLMYALNSRSTTPDAKFTGGKFRVIYHPDIAGPLF
jgi:hypothetical protein